MRERPLPTCSEEKDQNTFEWMDPDGSCLPWLPVEVSALSETLLAKLRESKRQGVTVFGLRAWEYLPGPLAVCGEQERTVLRGVLRSLAGPERVLPRSWRARMGVGDQELMSSVGKLASRKPVMILERRRSQ